MKDDIALQKASFAELPGWETSTLSDFRSAVVRSCAAPESNNSYLPGPLRNLCWSSLCGVVKDKHDETSLKLWLEHNTQPYLITSSFRGEEGLFTGYYEPLVRVSSVQGGRFQYPIYATPHDLVVIEDLDGGQGRRRVVRRDPLNGEETSYYTREAIVAGALQGRAAVLAWADSAVDVFFMQIQGCGVLQYEDGSVVRAGYAATNGHPYYAIGKALIARGAIAREDMSMQAIRSWLAQHPEQTESVLCLNPSYVFFRLHEEDGPIGSQGAPLTAGSSIAVDRRYIPMGAPLWVQTRLPGHQLLQKLMVAQDTGGAIRGVVRGDIFFGSGVDAGELAGKMKFTGKWWILIPKDQIQGDI